MLIPQQCFPALNALLQRGSSADQITAVWAIGVYGPDAHDSASLILKFLTDDSIMLRSAAVDALGRTGDTRVEVIDGLVKALSDGNVQVTLTAADALSRIGTLPCPRLWKGWQTKTIDGWWLRFWGKSAQVLNPHTGPGRFTGQRWRRPGIAA